MPRTGRPPRPALERFTRQTTVAPSGCHEWTGRIDRYGYGQFRPGGRHTSKVGAHRWAYEEFVGAIPAGLQVDHLCRNRKCVNPEHLEAVTPRENVLRSLNPPALNARKTHCAKGHPFSAENTSTYGNRRVCKACKAAYDAVRYRRKTA